MKRKQNELGIDIDIDAALAHSCKRQCRQSLSGIFNAWKIEVNRQKNASPECKLDQSSIDFFSRILEGIPDEFVDACDRISRILPLHRLGYRLLSFLYAGNSACVFSLSRIDNQQSYVLRIVGLNNDDADDNDKSRNHFYMDDQNFETETVTSFTKSVRNQRMAYEKCPNVPEVIDAFVHTNRVTGAKFGVTIMKQIDGVTLGNFIQNGSIAETVKLDIARKVGSALCTFHSGGLKHGDFHHENVIVDVNGEVHIIDFQSMTPVKYANEVSLDKSIFRYIDEVPEALKTKLNNTFKEAYQDQCNIDETSIYFKLKPSAR